MTEQAYVSGPYVDAEQQRAAGLMGMYVFLGSEIMLFGGLFAAALVIRVLYPHEVVEASKALHIWIGAINTAVLLTSSLAVAVAVHAARQGQRRTVVMLFAIAAVLGVAFLAIKAFEYSREYADGVLPGFSDPARFTGNVEHLFMNLYLIATALHALHVTVGVALLSGVATFVGTERLLLPRRSIVVENTGLYWHLVDAIWVFLYPVLYLAR
ncbi:cytochrome c oxidase subunit 3 [Reyranella sp.]|jgi:cytochrome c oxidase subunit 3|uniref:cytochrome c oxidase subunit 3 n=1 Tax=Reyranella sp. TaxID=1929291 RepID=UPI002F92EE0A